MKLSQISKIRSPLFSLLLHLEIAGSALAATFPENPPIPDTLGVQLKGDNDSLENLKQIQNLGLRWVRRGFLWQAVEKESGIYDFTKFDRFVADCKALNLRIIGCIALQNKLYSHPKDEPGRSAYINYAAALAARYKDDGIVWEIWNEPNTMTFWGKHGPKGNSEEYAAEYLSLVEAVVPAMKKADPGCVILGGSVSNMWTESYKWMDYCFAKGILKSGIDGWSVHPYGLKSPEDYIEAYGIMRKSMAASGGPADIPVLNSERGFPLRKKGEGYAGGDESMAREYQAWHLVRQYLIDLLCGVEATIWYEWAAKTDEKGFAIYAPGEPSPAFTACKVLVEELKGLHLEKRLDLISPRDFVLKFGDGQGIEKLVAWTAPPPHESPDKTEDHIVQIPVTSTKPAKVTDIYGNKKEVAVENGRIELKLTGAPQYVSFD